ncbi:S-layer homology domain-containing protein [Paenibacillus hemerocallicola]|nr:S-layer homology domain-containing protein [Paenibacillus hemerocallicola]
MAFFRRVRVAAALAATFLSISAVSEANASRFQMSYLYNGRTSDYAQYVDRAGGALQVVSPSYFDLKADGSLQITDKLDTAFVNDMHEQGIKVVPFLSNHWDRNVGLQALKQRDALAAQIVEAVKRYNLDGVNVDIENVTETSRDDYSDLVRMLRERLPAGKEVSVAVGANPTGWTKGWPGSYDYAALAGSSDYLMLMAYDETSIGDSVPGPVASIGYVEQSIRYALNYTSADKIVLGLPFYGRFWKTDGTISGDGIANSAVDALVSRYGGTTAYDTKSESAVSTFTVGPDQTPPVVNYKTLTPGTYVIWHENEQSMKRKLELVEQYGLKGTGSWSLGQESGDVWSYMSLWVNGAYFEDAEGHWARSEIASVFSKGWMTGTSPRLFGPTLSLTRAQAAAILTRAILPGQQAGTGIASGFSDVPASHWASGEIAAARQAGIVDGVAAGKFEPDAAVTRAQMAAMLARALKPDAPLSAKAAFSDVHSDYWAYPFIQALAVQGALQGYEPGMFRPDYPIQRSEMAALMDRLASSLPAN